MVDIYMFGKKISRIIAGMSVNHTPKIAPFELFLFDLGATSVFFRYFVTPLCELITKSVNCSIDDYSPDQRYILNLKLRLWSPMAAEAIKLALSHKGEHPNVNDIFALPMQLVVIFKIFYHLSL